MASEDDEPFGVAGPELIKTVTVTQGTQAPASPVLPTSGFAPAPVAGTPMTTPPNTPPPITTQFQFRSGGTDYMATITKDALSGYSINVMKNVAGAWQPSSTRLARGILGAFIGYDAISAIQHQTLLDNAKKEPSAKQKVQG